VVRALRALLAYATVTATSTPAKAVEEAVRTHVAFLITIGLVLIIIGLALSRKGLRGFMVGKAPSAAAPEAG